MRTLRRGSSDQADREIKRLQLVNEQGLGDALVMRRSRACTAYLGEFITSYAGTPPVVFDYNLHVAWVHWKSRLSGGDQVRQGR